MEERVDRLTQLIGPWSDVEKLPPAQLRSVFKQIVEHEDKTLLEALYACVAHDFGLIPSTPVWRLSSLMSDFELAAVHDKLVLFKRQVFGVRYKHVFTLNAESTELKPWSRWAGVIGFTLATTDKSYRIQTSPTSGSHLRKLGAVSESVGVREVAGAGLALVTGTPDVAGGVSEAAASPGDRKIAAAHVQLWQTIFHRLSGGESAPFDGRESAEQLLGTV